MNVSPRILRSGQYVMDMHEQTYTLKKKFNTSKIVAELLSYKEFCFSFIFKSQFSHSILLQTNLQT